MSFLQPLHPKMETIDWLAQVNEKVFKEYLTRRNNKGDSMNNEFLGADVQRCAMPKDETMSLKRFKELTDLSFKIKALIDKEMKDLKSSEACLLGDMMESIINLK